MKRNYGRLGKRSRHEWLRLLASDEGLFSRIREKGRFVGPTLTSDGITGDLLSVETMFFGLHATPEQQEFLAELFSTNPQAATEYLLTITNALPRWRQDIKWLEVAASYLKKERHKLATEESLAEKEREVEAHAHLPPVLRRHFPQLFADLRVTGFNELLEKIRAAEAKAEEKESFLERYLAKKRKEMPFLFS